LRSGATPKLGGLQGPRIWACLRIDCRNRHWPLRQLVGQDPEVAAGRWSDPDDRFSKHTVRTSSHSLGRSCAPHNHARILTYLCRTGGFRFTKSPLTIPQNVVVYGVSSRHLRILSAAASNSLNVAWIEHHVYAEGHINGLDFETPLTRLEPSSSQAITTDHT
jgi:hypothetical protein